VKSRKRREPPKKYTTPQFSQRLSRRGCVAQIECVSVRRAMLDALSGNVLNLRADSMPPRSVTNSHRGPKYFKKP
jgi:hypothetical protein